MKNIFLNHFIHENIYAKRKKLLSLILCILISIYLINRIEFLLGPCAILALVLNHEFSLMEILWTFSIYLESVAILPQLFMVQKTGEAESITSHYLFALGSYRGLYILNWIYRYYAEGKIDFALNPLYMIPKLNCHPDYSN